jgi:hypothetical protein
MWCSNQYPTLMKRPLTVQLVGGLGNQLFTYYACAAQAERLGVDLVLDDTRTAHGSSIRLFDLSTASVTASFVSRGERRPMRDRLVRRVVRQVPPLGRFLDYYESVGPGHEAGLIEVRPGMTVRGYFQSWRHVEEASGHAAPAALRLHQTSERLTEMIAQARLERPIGVHVRRGDYTGADTFGLVGSPYYAEAIKTLRSLGYGGPIWLFTDEPEAAIEVVPTADRIVSEPSSAPGELVLMSHMACFVTANSSFSWWGAWLTGSRAVVAPQPWFSGSPEPQGLVPPWWIRLPASWVNTT